MTLEEKKVASKTIFSGHIMTLEVADVKLPNGKMTTREIVHHAPAVAVLAIDDQNKMLLMKQWRAAVDQVTLEIPAGKLDDRDDSALHAAIRELNEETRLKATHLTEASSFYTSVGFCDEFMTLYVATGLTAVVNELPQDDDENLQVMRVSLDEALAMIREQKIIDAKTIMAIYHWQTLVLSGDLNES